MSPSPRAHIATRSTTAAVAVAWIALVAGATAASDAPAALDGGAAARPAPDIIGNTIDPVATRAGDGRRVRVTGPIGCSGGTITVAIRIDQASTGAGARGRWHGRCSGTVQHWAVRARARHGARFDEGRARVRASVLGGGHRWSEPVDVLSGGFGR